MTLESSEGLNFNNISEEVFRNTALNSILAILASLVTFLLLTIWIWPIKHAMDG